MMTDRDKIHYEAVRRVGNGMKGACFELGAEWALGTVTRINELAKQAHETAVKRCEEGNLDTCDNTLSCPVYALYVEATKKEKVVYKQDGWQEPPTPKAEII